MALLIGEVLDKFRCLIGATLSFKGKQFELCLYTDLNTKKIKNTKSFVVLYVLKKLPKVKIKAPTSVYCTPAVFMSKIEVWDAMKKVMKSMGKWKEMFVKNQGKKQRILHFHILALKNDMALL